MNYKYPEDINEHQFLIKFFKFDKEKWFSSIQAKVLDKGWLGFKNPESSIVLPIPNNLNETNTHSWSSDESSIAAGAQTALSEVPFVNSIIGSKKLINPNYKQEFQGSEPRSFSFEWIMIPQSKSEADSVMGIIKTLKHASSSESTGTMMSDPWIVDIKFANDKLNDMLQLQNFVIQSIDVQYNSQGYAEFYEDGMPKQITMSMAITEAKVMLKSDWEV